MNLKQRLIEKAMELGYVDIGFTGIEPFDRYIAEIESRPEEMYDFVRRREFNPVRGADFRDKHPWA